MALRCYGNRSQSSGVRRFRALESSHIVGPWSQAPIFSPPHPSSCSRPDTKAQTGLASGGSSPLSEAPSSPLVLPDTPADSVAGPSRSPSLKLAGRSSDQRLASRSPAMASTSPATSLFDAERQYTSSPPTSVLAATSSPASYHKPYTRAIESLNDDVGAAAPEEASASPSEGRQLRRKRTVTAPKRSPNVLTSRSDGPSCQDSSHLTARLSTNASIEQGDNLNHGKSTRAPVATLGHEAAPANWPNQSSGGKRSRLGCLNAQAPPRKRRTRQAAVSGSTFCDRLTSSEDRRPSSESAESSRLGIDGSKTSSHQQSSASRASYDARSSRGETPPTSPSSLSALMSASQSRPMPPEGFPGRSVHHAQERVAIDRPGLQRRDGRVVEDPRGEVLLRAMTAANRPYARRSRVADTATSLPAGMTKKAESGSSRSAAVRSSIEHVSGPAVQQRVQSEQEGAAECGQDRKADEEDEEDVVFEMLRGYPRRRRRARAPLRLSASESDDELTAFFCDSGWGRGISSDAGPSSQVSSSPSSSRTGLHRTGCDDGSASSSKCTSMWPASRVTRSKRLTSATASRSSRPATSLAAPSATETHSETSNEQQRQRQNCTYQLREAQELPPKCFYARTKREEASPTPEVVQRLSARRKSAPTTIRSTGRGR